ncbi:MULTISPECIES: hypothetical protein [unclassified Mesorhizobium]|uniref:hypothetical protein n=1 Tax=unclassified Mesorhizobium TaxID=325217 RepID=UPI001CCB9625|nr:MULTISPECIES: hypothetical protein [unclassified Mesorhizobium]MBZ9743576.1 hypothetical protein [Mesorhizobium sp. CO1-1-4]
MLVFDRAARPIDHRLQQVVMLGLAVRLPGDVVREHREIIRHDCIVLLIGPVTSHDRHQS